MQRVRRLLQQIRDSGAPIDAGPPLSVAFTPETADLIEFAVHAQTKSPWKRLHRRKMQSSFGINFVTWIVIGVSVTGLVNIFTRPNSPVFSNGWSFIVGMFTSLIIVAVLSVFARTGLIRRAMTRYLSDGSFESTLAPQQVDLRSDGVYCTTDFWEAFYRWPAINKVLQLPEVIYLYISSMQAVIIPRRAFSTDGDFVRFAAQAEEFWKSAQPDKTN